MLSCADVLAGTLRDAGITRMFGLPGGEILDFIDAARRVDIDFLLTRHEATASFMADVTGQITRQPAVCVSTLGPGAVNMTLGVANAFLDRSPLIAITAAHALSAAPYATHQKLDLNAIYRPLTKLTLTLDGVNTAASVRHAIRVSLERRMGPVHIALPSDVARSPERDPTHDGEDLTGAPLGQASHDDIERIAQEIVRARRPVAILGLDLNPSIDTAAARAFVEALGLPTFVTPKAKGLIPEDHPLFYGVCAGVSADSVILDFFERADLLVGIGFEPVESDKLWHHTMKLVSIGPVSIAADSYQPAAEAVGDVHHTLAVLRQRVRRQFEWTAGDRERFREALDAAMRPLERPRGLSGYDLTRRLRELCPRDAIFTTDVGSVKLITSQAWTSYEPNTFFESNGLSAMSYSFCAAMAARLQFPDTPILCTIGDGGFGMTLGEIETCVRERLHFLTVVFNDSSLSLIDMAQQRRGFPTLGVRYGSVDFAAVSAGLGAWSRRVNSMGALDEAVHEAMRVNRPAVIDAVVDPAEYFALRT